jgi:hypothetical protein
VPLPYFDVDWGDVSLDTDDGLTWSALKVDGWSAGPFLNYLSGRNANGSLRGLRDVPDMAQVGGFVQYSPAEYWRVYAQLGQAVGGAGGQGGCWGRWAGSWATRWGGALSAAASWQRTLRMGGRCRHSLL